MIHVSLESSLSTSVLVKNQSRFQVLHAKLVAHFAIAQNPSHPGWGSNAQHYVCVT